MRYEVAILKGIRDEPRERNAPRACNEGDARRVEGVGRSHHLTFEVSGSLDDRYRLSACLAIRPSKEQDRACDGYEHCSHASSLDRPHEHLLLGTVGFRIP
jgi:hypothetical protein